MRMFSVLLIAVVLAIGATSANGNAGDVASDSPRVDASPDAKCEHGVPQRLCTRCNSKLVPVYKAKGDWCAEHSRPESQCVICHPDLAKHGVK